MSRDPKSTYYDVGGIETLDVLKAKLTPEQYRGSLLGNVIKYACRLNFKGSAERDAEKLAIYSKELAAIACKQGGECMTIKRYDLLDLSTADGPSAMVTENEEGTYVLHADHAAEVAALKARIAELEKNKGEQLGESEEGFITNVELDSGPPDRYWDGKGDLHLKFFHKTLTLTMTNGTKKVFRYAL